MAISEQRDRSSGLSLNYRALKQADFWPSTAVVAPKLLDFYRLPSDLKGIKILDVCAGESDLTAALTESGAKAFAVDLLYSTPEILHQRVLNHCAARYLGKYEAQDNQSSFDDLESLALIAPTVSQGMDHFRRSFRKSRRRYISAMAHNLPFSDESFDYVLSFHGVLGVTQEDPILLTKSVEELIRIVRHDGQIQMGPMIDAISHMIFGRSNLDDLIKLLQRRKDLAVILDPVEYDGKQGKRLTLIKK
jgi:SAM-dependent methyltransferase